MRKVLPLVLLTLSLSGCYHATVVTGRPSSSIQVEKEWASSWLGGLVPPSTVDVGPTCPNGVSRVETQMSFLNMVAGAVTAGIYTPMSILAVCAS